MTREEICDLAPPAIAAELDAAGYAPDACVLGASALLDLLRRYGVTGKPMASRVVVFNAAAAAKLERDGWPTDTDWYTDDAWTVGIGGEGPTVKPEDRSPGWPWHLVVLTRNPDRLLDPTIAQVNRPAKGIELLPLSLPAPRGDVVKASGRLGYELDGMRLLYDLHPSELSYRTLPDYRQSDEEHRRRRADLARRAERRAELAHARMTPAEPV